MIWQSLTIVLLLICRTSVSVEWVSHHEMTSDQYQARFNEYSGQGYRLTWINGYAKGGDVRFAAIWEKKSGPAWVAHHGMSNSQYQQRFNTYKSQGYHVYQVSGYAVNGNDFYAAIWELGGNNGPWQARHGLTSDGFQREFDNLVGQGYRLRTMSGYSFQNSPRYAGVWDRKVGPLWVTHHGISSSQYQSKFNEYTSQGYVPKITIGFTVGSQVLFIALWEKPTSPVEFVARHHLTASQYQNEFTNQASRGFKLESVSGYVMNGGFRYVAIWHKVDPSISDLPIPVSSNSLSQLLDTTDRSVVENLVINFMKKWGVPGLSIAFGRNEKLVYANGFGFANRESREVVTVNHRFRIASVSKPITSAAVLLLIERGQISLDDFVFGRTGRLGDFPNLSNNVRSVRIRHLLQHTSGGWQNDNTDPVFHQLQLNNQDFLNFVLNNYQVSNVPGTNYAYSNFGYFLLARIIERVSGQTYEQFVQANVLQPADVTNAFIGGSTLAERRPLEATYYSSSGDGDPYEMNVRRMDGNGGWVMTATEVIRFIVRVDGFSGRPDILRTDTVALMSQGSTANPNYAMGWLVNPSNNWWHVGAMPGTAAELARIQSRRYCFAVTMNMRSTDDKFTNEIDQMMWSIFNGIRNWPDGVDP